MTVGKSPAELEAMITERLRDRPACAALARVVVVPQGSEGDWAVNVQPRMGMTVLDECRRAISAIASDIRREHHLVEIER